MADKLSWKKVAILAADGFEEGELTKPRKALDEVGAKSSVVSMPGSCEGELGRHGRPSRPYVRNAGGNWVD